MVDIKGFRKLNKLTQEQAAELFGTKRSFISHLETGRAAVPDSYAEIIRRAGLLMPPDRSDSEKLEAPRVKLTPTAPGKGLPLLPVSAIAGYLSGEMELDPSETEWYDVPQFRDCKFLIPIKGDSMIPYYLNGDIVACREVSDTGLFFQWGKTYVLDTSQGVVIKRIYESDKKDHILLFSENKEKYPAYDIPVESIHHIFLVGGLIREE